MPRHVWTEEFYVTAYELARAGMSEMRMAKSLGVGVTTLRKWKVDKPALMDAIKRGKAVGGGESVTATFHEYIFQKLPPHLAELFNDSHPLAIFGECTFEIFLSVVVF